MLTTVEASIAIQGAMPTFDSERVSLDRSTGRVLRQAVHAERDQPPFDRVMMDGIALRHAEFADGRREFAIQASQHAGDAVLTLEPDRCIEIMTGASLPDGADCIVPVERIEVVDGVARIEAGYEATERQHIHARGSDHRQDARLSPGIPLSPGNSEPAEARNDAALPPIGANP